MVADVIQFRLALFFHLGPALFSQLGPGDSLTSILHAFVIDRLADRFHFLVADPIEDGSERGLANPVVTVDIRFLLVADFVDLLIGDRDAYRSGDFFTDDIASGNGEELKINPILDPRPLTLSP
jgi:hypothetical protein